VTTHATYDEQARQLVRSLAAFLISLIVNTLAVLLLDAFHAFLEQVSEQQAAQLSVTTHATYDEQAHQLVCSLAAFIITLIVDILTLVLIANFHTLL
jgi:uncharacterized protein YsxB (DUF464 family)